VYLMIPILIYALYWIGVYGSMINQCYNPFLHNWGSSVNAEAPWDVNLSLWLYYCPVTFWMYAVISYQMFVFVRSLYYREQQQQQQQEQQQQHDMPRFHRDPPSLKRVSLHAIAVYGVLAIYTSILITVDNEVLWAVLNVVVFLPLLYSIGANICVWGLRWEHGGVSKGLFFYFFRIVVGIILLVWVPGTVIGFAGLAPLSVLPAYMSAANAIVLTLLILTKSEARQDILGVVTLKPCLRSKKENQTDLSSTAEAHHHGVPAAADMEQAVAPIEKEKSGGEGEDDDEEEGEPRVNNNACDQDG